MNSLHYIILHLLRELMVQWLLGLWMDLIISTLFQCFRTRTFILVGSYNSIGHQSVFSTHYLFVAKSVLLFQDTHQCEYTADGYLDTPACLDTLVAFDSACYTQAVADGLWEVGASSFVLARYWAIMPGPLGSYRERLGSTSEGEKLQACGCSIHPRKMKEEELKW